MPVELTVIFAILGNSANNSLIGSPSASLAYDTSTVPPPVSPMAGKSLEGMEGWKGGRERE